MRDGWQLFKIRGIPLRIHPTWFLILFAATLAFERHYRLALSESMGAAVIWFAAFITAVLLFVSVLLHELGHSLVALSQGVKVRSITLFLLGGVATVERDCPTALGALWVALAGPMVSLALAIGLLSSVHSIAHHSTVFAEIVTQLGVLNLVLALFNLLPGLPLDGGLVLKSLVWQVTGSRRRGLVVANAAGRFLSCLAVGLGTVLLLRGGGLSGTWLMLLGWFGLGAARNQDQLLRIQEALRNLRVRDASGRRFRVLEAGSTLRQLSQLEPSIPAGANPKSAITPVPHEWVLVCDRGRWRGVVTPSILQELPVQRWPMSGGMMQWPGSVPHAPVMHRRELTILASRNAPSADFTRIIRLIEDGSIDTVPWITHRIPFAATAATFPSLLEPSSGVIKAVVEMP